ncbi:MAG: 4-alpha-glucanotransferase [Bacteroidales bacterium]|nr:4-alpha-glucanotransferase [Bacteroidales bacterium]
MKLSFIIHYRTSWGQELLIGGSDAVLGSWDTEKAAAMDYVGKDKWSLTLELNAHDYVEYKYLIREANGVIHWEGGDNRNLSTKDYEHITMVDHWHPLVDTQRVLLSKVFTVALMKPYKLFSAKSKVKSTQTLRFSLLAPRINPGYAMAVVGNNTVLGDWKKPVLMGNKAYPIWELEFDLAYFDGPVSYKYVIIRLSDNKIMHWEAGENRLLVPSQTNGDRLLYRVNDEGFRYADNWKGAGVAVPVFSLRTKSSFGIGEFKDLKKLIDWCVLTGLKVIQILPINETVATHSWLDSYPYNSISVTALHPVYLNLTEIGKLSDQKLMKEFEHIGEKLNAQQTVDYVEVTRHKSRYFKLIFDQEWEQLCKTNTYKKFFKENSVWLQPYAAFCYLRDLYHTSDFRQWGDYSEYKPEQIAALTDPSQPFHEHIAIHYFIQYHLDKQLRDVVDYAHAHRVALKGDIPIGISSNSIEAWTDPSLFNLDGQAGAPPDDFAIMGQNWGFPTYNWDVMALNSYAWWRKRLAMMEKYFDAYRIDHILGFFRIWEIPKHALQGVQGYFKPGLPFSEAEIEEYGLWLDHDRFVKPYIRAHFLQDFFGEYTEVVRKNFLTEIDFDVFEVKPAFNTQRKVFDYFEKLRQEQEFIPMHEVIRDGLMGLLNEVLFIADPYSKQPGYHPRIALHYTYSYRELEAWQKMAFDELYIHFYYQRHDEFWKHHALSKLPALIGASDMMVCGEDLGMVPQSVPEVMRQLSILSLEIQRMPKNPDIEFAHPNDAPYLSVCSTSTHDLPTIRGWWEENRERTERFYRNMLGHNDTAPYFAEPWICREIVKQHLYAPAMWAIFPIQDLIAMDGELRWDETDRERINVPSNPENKWQYRMNLLMEELLEADDFNQMLFDLIRLSNRDQ